MATYKQVHKYSHLIYRNLKKLPTSYTVSGCVRSRQPSLDENDKLKMRNGGQDRRDGHYGHDGQESQDSQDGQDGHDSHERNRSFFIIAQVKVTLLDLNT